MDFPSFPEEATPLFVSSVSRWTGLIPRVANGAGAPGVVTWATNTTVYVPLSIPWPYTVRRWWWHNGSTLTNSFASVALYHPSGARIATSGAISLSGASAVQYDATNLPIRLSPGQYYLGFSLDDTTSRGFGYGVITAVQLRTFGCLQETVHPCPASMTAAVPSTAIFELFGITRTPTGF